MLTCSINCVIIKCFYRLFYIMFVTLCRYMNEDFLDLKTKTCQIDYLFAVTCIVNWNVWISRWGKVSNGDLPIGSTGDHSDMLYEGYIYDDLAHAFIVWEQWWARTMVGSEQGAKVAGDPA